MNYFTRNADLVRHFERLPWAELSLDAAAVQGLRDVLTAAGRYIGREVAARAAEVDDAGTSYEPPIRLSGAMEDNLEGLRELGLMGLTIPVEHGGAGLPFVASSFVLEMLARACPSTAVQFAFYSIPAALLLRFGTEAQKARWVPALAEGRLSGAVAMTEPEAGSDVGALSTRAEPEAGWTQAPAAQEAGWWRLYGRKQFISNGWADFCIVLARSDPGSRGLEGLSLFLVPRRLSEGGPPPGSIPAASGPEAHPLASPRTPLPVPGLPPRRWPLDQPGADNYLVERAEEKVCLNGSPTCALSFSGSWGQLLGRRGDGWRQILSFMNESRLGVGIQAVGQLQAAFQAARDYAAHRVQMDRPIREHPLVAEMLVDMETSLVGLRALVFEAALLHQRTAFRDGERAPGEASRVAESEVGQARRVAESDATQASREGEPDAGQARRVGESDATQASRLRELTPLVKYLAAEEAVRQSRLALQIYGGYGVIRDYQVERLVRESLILPIYEGTSQIQALMATKDLLRAVARRPLSLLDGSYSPALKAFRPPRWMGRDFRAAHGDLTGSLRFLVRKVGWRAMQDGDEPPHLPLLHAERLCQMLAHLHLARCLAGMAEEDEGLRALAQRAAWRARGLCRERRREIATADGLVAGTIARWREEREASP